MVLSAGFVVAAPARAAKKSTPKTAQAKPKSKAAKPRQVTARSTTRPAIKPQTALRTSSSLTKRPTTTSKSRRTRRVYNPWDTPTYADSTLGDSIDGEDLVVRKAAVEALGPYNGSVVVVDPNTGRVLTMVNQKLALTGSFQPCSTIKLVAGVAALSEGLIQRETQLKLGRRTYMDLTMALAKSNNPYFYKLGEQLGFEKVNYYARLFGLGERAGLNIEGESEGAFPSSPIKGIPVGMMTSYGEGIGLTPLQLAAVMSTLANGGTLHYLQYPRNQEEILNFVPRVKRYLDIQQWIPELKPGLMGAVDYGTARRASYDPNEPIMGKTGTCTDSRTHLGWFGSFNEVGRNKLTVVVLLTGGRPVNGPTAAGIAGAVYRNLSGVQYFAQGRPTSPNALVSSGCCSN